MEFGSPITSRANARVKALRGALSGKASQVGELVGLEGERLLLEAHHAGLRFETLYVRQGSESLIHPDPALRYRANEIVLLSPDVFDSAVTTRTPQGIAATWRIAEPARKHAQSTILVLEDLQDPGNLGTLIRTTAAFGGSEVWLTARCANPWSPKALRSSAGAAFRVPVRRAPLAEIAATLRDQGIRLFAAVAGFPGEHSFSAPHGPIYGRQANTTAAKAYKDSEGNRTGPHSGPVASLSYDADFLQPCAILIGNEGAGLSAEALALADEQVQIPCSVESLNAAVAGSILLYEAMRQIPLRAWAKKQGLRPYVSTPRS